jgi:hypothetical protein
MAIPDLKRKSEVAVMEYYGGILRCAPVIRLDGKHTNDPEIDKSIPLEVVEISSLNLAMTSFKMESRFSQST